MKPFKLESNVKFYYVDKEQKAIKDENLTEQDQLCASLLLKITRLFGNQAVEATRFFIDVSLKKEDQEFLERIHLMLDKHEDNELDAEEAKEFETLIVHSIADILFKHTEKEVKKMEEELNVHNSSKRVLM